jgi:hypothetical protein
MGHMKINTQIIYNQMALINPKTAVLNKLGTFFSRFLQKNS